METIIPRCAVWISTRSRSKSVYDVGKRTTNSSSKSLWGTMTRTLWRWRLDGRAGVTHVAMESNRRVLGKPDLHILESASRWYACQCTPPEASARRKATSAIASDRTNAAARAAERQLHSPGAQRELPRT